MDANAVAEALGAAAGFGGNGPGVNAALDQIVIDAHATGRPIDPDALFDGLFERLASLVPDEDQRLVLATMYARRVADGLRLLGAYDLRRAARPPA